jgi:hypothetical protein
MKKTIVFDFGAVPYRLEPLLPVPQTASHDEAIKSFLKRSICSYQSRIDDGMRLADWSGILSEVSPHSELIAAYHARFTESVGDCLQGTVEICTN